MNLVSPFLQGTRQLNVVQHSDSPFGQNTQPPVKDIRKGTVYP